MEKIPKGISKEDFYYVKGNTANFITGAFESIV